VTDELGLIVLAVIFACGVAGAALLLIGVLPAVMAGDSRLSSLLARRSRQTTGRGSDG
jgi:hypothetical protein